MQRRPLIVVLVLVVVSVLSVAGTAHAAVGDLPRLTEASPAGIDASWYDDHSVIGDGHLSWSSEGGDDVHVNTAGPGVAERAEGHRVRSGADRDRGGRPRGLRVSLGNRRLDARLPGGARRPDSGRLLPRERAGDRPARLVPLHLRPPQPGRRLQPLAHHGPRALRARAAARRRRRPGGRHAHGLGQPLGHVPGSRDGRRAGELPDRPQRRAPRRRGRERLRAVDGDLLHDDDPDAGHHRRAGHPDPGEHAAAQRRPAGERPLPGRRSHEPVRTLQGGRWGDRQRVLHHGQPLDRHGRRRLRRDPRARRRGDATATSRPRSTRC